MIKLECGDIIKMKKKHPCGSDEWEVIKVGADIKLKCCGCMHEIILKRSLVVKLVDAVADMLRLHFQVLLIVKSNLHGIFLPFYPWCLLKTTVFILLYGKVLCKKKLSWKL